MREWGGKNLCQDAVWLHFLHFCTPICNPIPSHRWTISTLSGSSSPPAFWDWFSSRFLTLKAITWHPDHACSWALRLLLRPCITMPPLPLELSPESSLPWSLAHVPSLYIRSYNMALQILTKSLNEDLFYPPKPPFLHLWLRILYTLIVQVEHSRALCLHGEHVNHDSFCIHSDHALDFSGVIVLQFQEVASQTLGLIDCEK